MHPRNKITIPTHGKKITKAPKQIKVPQPPKIKNKIAHFVLSRFNIHLREYLKTTSWDVTEDEWMDDRLSVIENTTARSLRNQTCDNFLWLCFFDYRTSVKHRQRIGRIYEIIPNFIPVYVKVFAKIPNYFSTNFQRACKRHVFELCDRDTDIVIQTRIDIDDYLHRTFIQKVQDYAITTSAETKQLLIFPYGYNLNMRGWKKELWKRYYDRNQFCSFVEKYGDEMDGVWRTGHESMSRYGKKVIMPEDDPMWLWIAHDYNLSDRINFPWRVHSHYQKCSYDKEKLESEFSFNESILRRMVKCT